MTSKPDYAEIGTRLHREIERIKLICGDSHIGLDPQLLAYASTAELGEIVVVIGNGGDLLCDIETCSVRDPLHDPRIDFAHIERRMLSQLTYAGAEAFPRLPKRERTRDWEQRDRKRRRK